MISVPVPAGLIGDTLATIPYILERCRQHGTQAYVGKGFNPAVRDLVEGIHPLIFQDAPEDVEATYSLDLSAMWHLCEQHGWMWNMAQGYFVYNDLHPPKLPCTFAMNELLLPPNDMLPTEPGIMIAPYSRTNNPADNNKLWPHDRWVDVVWRLRRAGADLPVYILGSSQHDDPSPYSGEGFIKMFDCSLPFVLGMLRRAKLVMTIDNGIGHLCHFGGVRNHVMQYPACLPPKFAESPFAEHVRGPMPIAITAHEMAVPALMVLSLNP
jgi:hypothetical protein